MDGPKQIISRTIIDRLTSHPKGIIGRTLINFEGKNIVFNFEWRIFSENSIQIHFFKNGDVFFYRKIRHSSINDNIDMLTDEECLLLSFLILGVVKVLEKYEEELESENAAIFVKNELVLFEMDILPEKESDKNDLLSVLSDSPVAKM